MKKNNINLVNLGCRLNIYEGEVIKTLAKKNHLNNFTIINSCSVTEEAEKKVKYEIRKSKKNFPEKKIIVTGCAAQINPKEYADIDEVDFVIGNKEKLQSDTWASLSEKNPIQVNDIFADNTLHNNIVEKFEGKSRAYIEIQQGCDHRCTFCIIPYGRGNNRSVPIGVIVDRVKILVNNGYNEVVFTGVDIKNNKSQKWRVENSWGNKNGDKGYYLMSDDWFDEYNYEVVVDKKYLSKKILSIFDLEPEKLSPWDPMGALAFK